jgi:hypothetical protein
VLVAGEVVAGADGVRVEAGSEAGPIEIELR